MATSAYSGHKRMPWPQARAMATTSTMVTSADNGHKRMQLPQAHAIATSARHGHDVDDGLERKPWWQGHGMVARAWHGGKGMAWWQMHIPSNIGCQRCSLSASDTSLGRPHLAQKSFSPETCLVFAHTTLLTLLLGINHIKYILGVTLK
jgi:hypothetical protein